MHEFLGCRRGHESLAGAVEREVCRDVLPCRGLVLCGGVVGVWRQVAGVSGQSLHARGSTTNAPGHVAESSLRAGAGSRALLEEQPERTTVSLFHPCCTHRGTSSAPAIGNLSSCSSPQSIALLALQRISLGLPTRDRGQGLRARLPKTRTHSRADVNGTASPAISSGAHSQFSLWKRLRRCECMHQLSNSSF